ncbi:MAG: hypothetical protein ACRDD7_15865 [Peptostreptococcaceae bacterium]
MKVQSNVMPTLEIKSTFVRIPSNIVMKTRTIDDVTETYYEYDEEIVSSEDYITRLSSNDINHSKKTVDLDFRVFEIECVIEDTMPSPMMARNKNMKGSDDMTPYEMMKVVILANQHDRADYEYKINAYTKRGRMTQEQADELIALMDAQELLYGKR